MFGILFCICVEVILFSITCILEDISRGSMFPHSDCIEGQAAVLTRHPNSSTTTPCLQIEPGSLLLCPVDRQSCAELCAAVHIADEGRPDRGGSQKLDL